MQPGAATINDGIGAIPQPFADHPQVLALSGQHTVCGVPNELRAARAELPLGELGAKHLLAPVDRPPQERGHVARRPFRLLAVLRLREVDRGQPVGDRPGRLVVGSPLKDFHDDRLSLLVDRVKERPPRRVRGGGWNRWPPLVADRQRAHRRPGDPAVFLGSLDPPPGEVVGPAVMPERRVQAFRPVFVGGVDKICRADHPDSGIDRRVEKLRCKRHMPVEPARLLCQDDVPAVGLDASPDLVDSGPVGDLSADLRLADDLHVHLLGPVVPGKVGCQEPLAGVDLSIDARLTLLVGRVACVDQNIERTIGRHD